MGSNKNVGFGLITLFLSFQPSISFHGSTEKEESEGGFVKVNVSEVGLDFAQKILIQRAIEDLTPFHVPDISRSVRIPFIGNVEMGLSNIVLSSITVSSSRIQPGDTGILIYVTGATANISMDWSYSYSTWLVPVTISDSGNASSEVRDWKLVEIGNFVDGCLVVWKFPLKLDWVKWVVLKF